MTSVLVSRSPDVERTDFAEDEKRAEGKHRWGNDAEELSDVPG